MNKSPQHTFDCHPQRVAKWLEELPRGSVGRTAEHIYNALKDINSQTLKASDRFHVLEALRSNVDFVTTNMEEHISSSMNLFADKTMMVTLACQSILEHMANGYIMVFHELQKHNSLFVDKKMMATTVYRAMRLIEQSLMIVYQIHSAYIYSYWEKLNELYHYAEILEIENDKVASQTSGSKNRSSIKQEYIRALLLYLAEPYHLRINEIKDVIQIIEEYGSECTLEGLVDCEIELSTYDTPVIIINQDEPPKFIQKLPDNDDVENYRVIRTDKLLARLAKIKTEEENIGTKNELHAEVINTKLFLKLLSSWRHKKRRRFPRQNIFKKIVLTIGLGDTHLQLLYDAYKKQPAQNTGVASTGKFRANYESIEITGVNPGQFDIWDKIYAWSQHDKKESDKSSKNDTIAEIENAAVEDWTLLNESAEGFCLMNVDKDTNNLQVGEIISLQGSQNTTMRNIGIVLWTKIYGKNQIEVGGKYIAATAEPVSARYLASPVKNIIINRGLILPGIESLKRPESILTVSRQYKEGDMLAIEYSDGKCVTIQLLKLLADNYSICQYLFKRMDDADAPHKDKKSNDSSKDEFDSVWKII